MSRICVLTGKKANVANNRSHSNRATKRLQGVNLQSRRMGGVKVVLSTRALKTLKKLNAIQKGEVLTKKQKKKAKTAARKAEAKK
ncbi:MAG: 50S ribosomal protein L28 [Patescibacteria group bacterium]|nr:50S ribosomal protein L28 [Patescibacteria group bacterium]